MVYFVAFDFAFA